MESTPKMQEKPKRKRRTIPEQIEVLKQKEAAIQAQRARLEAAGTKEQRIRENRRKYILGGVLLGIIEKRLKEPENVSEFLIGLVKRHVQIPDQARDIADILARDTSALNRS
jgi:hypothetical protein